MKIDNLRVHWRYENVVVIVHPGKVTEQSIITEMTTCFISSCVSGTKEMITIGIGQTTCSPYEVANKDRGRKIALKRALDNLPSNKVKEVQTHEFVKEQKKFRARFWEAYRVMTPTPRWSIKKAKEAQKA